MCLETLCSASFKHVGELRLGILLFDDVHALLSLGRESLVCMCSHGLVQDTLGR